ncbi:MULTISPECIES: glycosyltransferase family 4 protein [Mesorhizobium]|uniref:Glycosyltransferase n=1 Tax=Mesorhizobium denitrificans TaxID=2294114 RepID=A0A371X4I9_9HYPH|nr:MULTISPECIES: glycosyltransferase family 4 protein [Mesorhizobium]RFC63944.1 glycosyltransferase [Mesorhizobium denitrificans]
MRIAFYAPLKAPDHPVPSGDRQMARLLIEALEFAGHTVELASSLRAFCATPDPAHYEALAAGATTEGMRIEQAWQSAGVPDVWFTYHPYYKAPDLLGLVLAQRAGIPYITAEASYSVRRNEGVWRQTQDTIVEAVQRATVNLCFTERDASGLKFAAPNARLERFSPFIKPAAKPVKQLNDPLRLITVAMMRPGDKLESYRMLADVLVLLGELPWTITIVGDGPAAPDVRQLFSSIQPSRIHWAGQVAPQDVPAVLAQADLYVWPGFGEAYGLAYLEAQAAELPVVAQRIAGVPEAVRDGETAMLTEPGDVAAFANAIAKLLTDANLRQHMGERGRAFVTTERSLEAAAQRLDKILAEVVHV